MNTVCILTLVLLAISLASSAAAQTHNESLFINCGPTTKSLTDNRVWKRDDDPAFAPPDINSISYTAAAMDNSLNPPYDTARIFHSRLTYSFSLTPGPKFIRLHFTASTSYNNNNISASQYYLSLQANQVILFKNFSSFLNSPQNNKNMYEFHLNIGQDSPKNLNLSFSPGDGANDNTSTHAYGFINAIEIVPVTDGLYNLSDPSIVDLSNPEIGYTPDNFTALQSVIRLNVGGSLVEPQKDSGSMWRTWLYDRYYLSPGGPSGSEGGSLAGTTIKLNYTKVHRYVAPDLVYDTVRILGASNWRINLQKNLTWKFEVDTGFQYLIRLHYCETLVNITGQGQRSFNVYINNQTAATDFDVWEQSGGLGVPIYRDYVIQVYGGASGGVPNTATKVPFWLALHPRIQTKVTDVLLNGLEIFKLSEINGSTYNLAAPNPPQAPSPSPPTILGGSGSNQNHSLAIIGGAIGGAVLVSLSLCACLVVYKRRANKEEIFGSKTMATNSSSKSKWIPTFFDSAGSTASTVNSSLPSDICHRFSLAQIRVATCDFDENLVIGKGGFGKVYKGTITDGVNGNTQVAIKRLNHTSKQGAREFQTEIEMLSRLRHMHLVSLIGYCEDHGEMILVYEYMSNGSLRDHLMYKNSERNDKSNTTPLSWKQRLVTCVGSARGLHYLHAGARQLVIHRDVKSTNILLDDKWTAKVSDFGLSKAGPIPSELGPTYISTAVKGSAGYLDPEYYRRHQLTEKSDVYSFGVVLFEVLCARAAINPSLPKAEANLAVWARNHYKRGTLHNIVDPNLTGQIAPECLQKFGEIAEMCVRDRGSERPSMGDVVWVLEFALQLQETAERKNISGDGDSLEESLVPSNNNFDGGNSGNTDNDVFTSDYFSPNTNEGGGATSSGNNIDSKTTASHSSECAVDMMSGSVFSEIIDPTAR